MFRTPQRKLSRKHSQNVIELHLAYSCASSRSSTTPELKKLASRDSTETEDEVEEKLPSESVAPISSSYLALLESGDLKDFVDGPNDEMETQIT